LSNRVDPWGRIQVFDSRGSLMGNRGILHNEDRELVAQWKHKAWITCRLRWRGRKRQIMAPRRYTELFFLDEASAFAAGHRPCWECRRGDHKRFKRAWLAADESPFQSTNPSIGEIDKVIHRERVKRDGIKVTYGAPISSLPNGAMVALGRHAHLIWGGGLIEWSFEGYAGKKNLPVDAMVEVLTPASVVGAFRHGYVPKVHESALQYLVS
jgi:hypothetical protein